MTFLPLQSPSQVDSVTIQTQFISSPATSNRTSRRRHSAGFRVSAVPMDRVDLLLLIMPPVQSPRRLGQLNVKRARLNAWRGARSHSKAISSTGARCTTQWSFMTVGGSNGAPRQRHHYKTIGHNMHNQRWMQHHPAAGRWELPLLLAPSLFPSLSFPHSPSSSDIYLCSVFFEVSLSFE